MYIFQSGLTKINQNLLMAQGDIHKLRTWVKGKRRVSDQERTL